MKLIIRFLMMFCLLLVGVDGYSLYANPNVVTYPPADTFNISLAATSASLVSSSTTTIKAATYEVSREDETAVSSDEDEDEDEGFSFKKSVSLAAGSHNNYHLPLLAGRLTSCAHRYPSFHRHFAYLSSTRYILFRVIRL